MWLPRQFCDQAIPIRAAIRLTAFGARLLATTTPPTALE